MPKLRNILTVDIKAQGTGLRFGWGHKLDVCIVETLGGNLCGVRLYDLFCDEVTVKEKLFVRIPKVGSENTMIFITSTHILVQGEIHKVCLYSRNDFKLVEHLDSPGWLLTLSNGGIALVETSSVGSNVWKLLLAPLSALSKPYHHLQIPKAIFGHDNRMKACISPNRCAAITYQENRSAMMIICDENGEWDTSLGVYYYCCGNKIGLYVVNYL